MVPHCWFTSQMLTGVTEREEKNQEKTQARGLVWWCSM